MTLDDATITIHWLGHATTLIVCGDTWLLTDPLLRGRAAHLRRRLPLAPADWPERVDAVLLSHLHLDHCDLPTLERLGRDRLLLVPEGAGSWLRGRGFRNVEELAPGASRTVERLTLTATPAHHGGRRPPFGPSAPPIGYLIEGPRRIYFPGDTDLFPEMASLAGDLDLALLPIWGWGPTLGPGHLDPERAVEALLRLRPRRAIPIHWGTFHPWGTALRDRRFLEEPPRIFARLAAERAPDVTVTILAPGERIVLG